MAQSHKLVDRGFERIADIGRKTRAEFVTAMGDDLGDFHAAQLKVKADAICNVLNHQLAFHRIEHANFWAGYENGVPKMGQKAVPKDQVAVALETDPSVAALFPNNCSCEDCEAAVSPLAYLADLLDYAPDRHDFRRPSLRAHCGFRYARVTSSATGNRSPARTP